MLLSSIKAASKTIDNYCQRTFGKREATSLYFSPESSDLLLIPDLLAVTEIATDLNGQLNYGEVWTPGDYRLAPINAAALDQPYTQIEVTPLGRYRFPRYPASTRITGDWGWNEVPDDVHEACLLLAFRLYKRKDAPFGVVGSNDLGQFQAINKRDPDAMMLLDPYRRFGLEAI